MTISGMKDHLSKIHQDVPLDVSSNNQEQSEDQQEASETTSSSSKRSGTMAQLHVLCSRKNRKELFKTTIPEWVESTTQMDHHSPRAQKFHRAIFERMVLDLVPFYEAAKPGYLREKAVMNPNFTVASPTYYRSMLGKLQNSILIFLSKLGIM